MNKLIKETYFSGSPYLQKTIVKKLNANGYYYLDDLCEVNHYELFKIYALGINKFALIQKAMQVHGLKFKDDRYIKYDGKMLAYLEKHGVN